MNRRPLVVGWLLLAVIVTVFGIGPAAWAKPKTPPTAPPAEATTESPLRVLYMGDSLADAARDFFTRGLTANDDAVINDELVRGGTAICDWLPMLEAELTDFAPQVAVVVFSGNSLTPCMLDPETDDHYVGDAKVAKYRADALAAMATFDKFGVEVYWIGAPPTRDDTGAQAELNEVYRRIARRSPSAHYLDAGASVTDDGSYTDYLPCLLAEPCTDTDPSTGEPAAKIRAPDGAHFCPNSAPAFGGVTQPCEVFSSGAWRFGSTMANEIVNIYGL